jgi:c-di-GMP-binding flagellar brake protein YcgR
MGATKEIRKHPRRSTEGMTLTCYRTQPMAAYQPRRNIGEAVLDISAGGCRVRITEHILQGAGLTIELKDGDDKFHAHGQVRWIEPKDVGGRAAFIAGVQFSEILTPLTKREKFFLGKAALAAVPAAETTPRGGTRVTTPTVGPAARFKVDDYVVTAFRAGLLSTVGLRKNLAMEVVDLSRTGAQIVSMEKLPLGTRVSFTLHLNKFADTFETDADVIWTKEGKDATGTFYYTGLQFGEMAPAKAKLVEYMMSWFTSYQAKYRQEQRGT